MVNQQPSQIPPFSRQIDILVAIMLFSTTFSLILKHKQKAEQVNSIKLRPGFVLITVLLLGTLGIALLQPNTSRNVYSYGATIIGQPPLNKEAMDWIRAIGEVLTWLLNLRGIMILLAVLSVGSKIVRPQKKQLETVYYCSYLLISIWVVTLVYLTSFYFLFIAVTYRYSSLGLSFGSLGVFLLWPATLTLILMNSQGKPEIGQSRLHL